MAIDRDWQAELRGLTVGAGTPYTWSGQITGLGIPAARTRDTERGDLDGDVGGDDTLPRRVLTLPLNVDGTGPADAWAKFQALKAAWRPSIVDLELDLRLPGFVPASSTLRFYGRPRGIDDDLEQLKQGHADALAMFEALDPFGYGDEDTVTDDGVFVVTNPGDASTDRVVLVFHGDGGTPVLTNADDAGGSVGFTEPLPGGSTLTVDLRARTVLDDTAEDRYELVTPGSLFFVLVPGDNHLTLAGADSVDVIFRPAFH